MIVDTFRGMRIYCNTLSYRLLAYLLPSGTPKTNNTNRMLCVCLHRVFEKDGSTVVCDEVSFGFLKGAKVEFEDNLMRSAFTVRVQS